MINTKLTIDGSDHSDFKNLKVNRKSATDNAVSTFEAEFPSPYGRHSDSFSIGNEVIVYADQDTSAVTKIFTGLIEKTKFRGRGTEQTLVLTGRDYSLRLQDMTVEPIVYNESEVSTIVKNIIDLQIKGITYTNVDTTTVTLEKISFNHQTVWDSLMKLAKLSGYVVWIDEDKDLNFKLKDAVSSGVTLSNEIKKATFNTTKEGMANSVWVYGDRILTRANNEFYGDGAGSVFTLTSKPHNLAVFVEDTLISPGGVGGLDDPAMGDAKYLVDFSNKQVTFTSGTVAGENIPGAGSKISIDYDRRVPIVKFGEDQSSISVYGRKEKVIVDNNIISNTVANQMIAQQLVESSPFKGLELNLNGWFTFKVGEMVTVIIPDFDLTQEAEIIGIDYLFNSKSVTGEDVIKIRVDKKIFDITDSIKDLNERITNLENPQLADILTRYYRTTGEMDIVGSSWKVSTKTYTPGYNFILGNPPFAILGSATNAATLGLSGGTGPTFQVVASGGYTY